MNWHAVAIAGFLAIAFCAFCALVTCWWVADDPRRSATKWMVIMLGLMAIDVLLAGVVFR